MYLIRQVIAPLRIPMRVSDTGELLHAVPRSEYTRFDSEREALEAIGSTILCKGRDDAEFEIIPVGEYEDSLSAAEKRSKKVKRAARQAKRQSDAA